MNLYTANETALAVTDALNTLGVKGTHDQDVAAHANEANYFWEVPLGNGRVVFACLWFYDGDAGFGVDVRGRDGEPIPGFGDKSAEALTAPVLTALIARSAALAELGRPLTALDR